MSIDGVDDRMTVTTVGDALNRAAARLDAAGCATARLDARVLLAHVLNADAAALPLRRDDPLDTAAVRAFETLIDRREAREPVAHLTGIKGFWAHDFVVSADVLTPRPDSETLVETALAAVAADAPARVLDLGTGSGCLLLSVLAERPRARGVGIDTSRAALAVARANADRLGLADRVRFEAGAFADAAPAALGGPFDAVLANPPYIPSAEIDALAPELAYEPRAALDGGADGYDAYRALAPRLPALLAAGGAAVFEVGDGQADAVAGLLCGAGLSVGAPVRDLGGIARCVVARAARACAS
jgi:release factor glutamine methyltransferase